MMCIGRLFRYSLLPALLAVLSSACTSTVPQADINAILQHNPYGNDNAAEKKNVPPPPVAQLPKPVPAVSGPRPYLSNKADTWHGKAQKPEPKAIVRTKNKTPPLPVQARAENKPKASNSVSSSGPAAQVSGNKLPSPAHMRKDLPSKPEQMQKTINMSQKKLTLSIDNEKVLKFYCQWPIKGKVMRGFSKTGNKGIDIGARYAQPVKAAAAGRVVYSGQGLRGYGNLLIIEHEAGFLSAYGNNSKLLVNKGQQVEAGRTIAEAGTVAGREAVLHFEIRKNGKPVNPMEYLPR